MAGLNGGRARGQAQVLPDEITDTDTEHQQDLALQALTSESSFKQAHLMMLCAASLLKLELGEGTDSRAGAGRAATCELGCTMPPEPPW